MNTHTSNEHVLANVRFLMNKRKLNIKTLAIFLDKSYMNTYNLLKQNRRLRDHTVEELARALNVSEDFLRTPPVIRTRKVATQDDKPKAKTSGSHIVRLVSLIDLSGESRLSKKSFQIIQTLSKEHQKVIAEWLKEVKKKQESMR